MHKLYATPGPMTTLPEHPALADLPTDWAGLRAVIQGLLLHRDWAPTYGVTGDAIRLDEQNLRPVSDVLTRAFELSPAPVTQPRRPEERVLTICRHFALLYTAFLRAQGTPARVRCGFSNYFDRTAPDNSGDEVVSTQGGRAGSGGGWYDHWITERWDADGARWVRDDPQIDDLQAKAVGLDFDPYDQPPGRFMSGAEAWIAARAGDVDPTDFGIFDMWGLPFISGNVVHDFACLNKVELLPWDSWGMMTGPHRPVPDTNAEVLDDLAALVVADDTDTIRELYDNDPTLRVPPDVTTVVDGRPAAAHLAELVPATLPG